MAIDTGTLAVTTHLTVKTRAVIFFFCSSLCLFHLRQLRATVSFPAFA